MPVDDLPRHGGDLGAATRRYGSPPSEWLDLSTGINPLPYPPPPLAAHWWSRLPDGAAEEDLVNAAARYYGAGAGVSVVAAPGTQALIQWLPRLRGPSRVAVVGPTYAEHAAAWAGAGHQVTEAGSLDEAMGADVVVVVNPNNPDGRVLTPERLAAAAARVSLLVVDEAFADAAPSPSLAGRAGDGGVVVLRSFGKFFGLAGVRLGFALTDATMATALKTALGPWPVAGPTLAVGTAALGDATWIEATRAALVAMSDRLDAVLSAVGLEVVGGTPLFRFVKVPGDAWAMRDRLARRGILVRAFAWSPDRLRFGLPCDDRGLERISAALRP